MGILGLHTSDYESYYSGLYNKIPAVKVKFRDQLCFSGKKYEYEDVSKVWVTNAHGKIIITPKIFCENESEYAICNEVDYIGLYAIGAMELVYLVLSSSLKQDGGEPINHLSELFDNMCKNIYKDFKDIEQMYEKIFDNTISKEYDKAFNLFFSMRTDYSKMAYKHVMRYSTVLMMIWATNPRYFWEIFFEIMTFVSPLYLMLLQDVICKDGEDSYLINYWLNADRDLHFKRIEYIYPATNTKKQITDCRGLSILSCLSLYYGFLYNHGYDPSKSPVLSHKNKNVVEYLLLSIANCIGNDYQSRFLMGEGISEPCLFDLRGAYYSSIQDKLKSNLTTNNMSRHVYEDLILFSIAHQDIDESTSVIGVKSTDVNMHYSSVHEIFQSIGYILYTNYDQIISVDIEEYENQIKNLNTQNNRLINDLNRLRSRVDEVLDKCIDKSEVEQKDEKIAELQRIIDSKSEIIEQLSNENKELNLFISNIYSDDDSIQEETKIELSISEMVEYLNNFKFLMVGGRFDLIQKLNEYGWNNLDQFDGRKNLGSSQMPNADFYVLNTKFISHKVTWKVESEVEDSEVIMYYNGTNPEKLIQACYEFTSEFFK